MVLLFNAAEMEDVDEHTRNLLNGPSRALSWIRPSSAVACRRLHTPGQGCDGILIQTATIKSTNVIKIRARTISPHGGLLFGERDSTFGLQDDGLSGFRISVDYHTVHSKTV
jgi:hypothetical protein